MATGRVRTELEEGRCSICLENPKDPALLPCQHIFCKTCISQYIHHTKETETKHIKVPDYSCPVCRTEITSEIQYFDKLAQRKMETETKFECGPCKERGKNTLAIKWCRDCQEPFCENCTVEHKSFKCSRNHKVSSLEELRGQKDVKFFVDFSDKCPLHLEHIAEVYCFDHKQLCCVSCALTVHKKCKNVSTIKDLVDKKNDSKGSRITPLATIESDLSKIQIATDELLQEKMADKNKVERSFLDIEESMNATVQRMKDNLDTLMISFRKELHLKQDDYEAKVNPIIKEIETFKETIAKAVQNVEFVRNYGTSIQLFIYFEKTKEEITRILEDRIKPMLNNPKLEIQLVLEDVVGQIEQLSNLGKSEFLEKTDEASSTFISQINRSFCKLINIDTIKVKRDKIIEIGGNVQGGTSVDDTTIVVTCVDNIVIFDIMTAKKVKEYQTCVGFSYPTRLSYEKESMCLYISFGGGKLQRIKYDKSNREFSDHRAIKSALPYNGAICNDGESFYTIVNQGVCKNENVQIEIFTTDTYCYNCLNGLAFDKKNKRFIYTSRSNEVVAISEQGIEIFRFKDNNMKKVSSVAVLDCGIIIAGDETGSVHAISGDGKRRTTLIEKCEKITNVCDVWVDKDSKTLFVCGNTLVEIYNIH